MTPKIPRDRWIPLTKGNNTEDISICWRHHELQIWPKFITCSCAERSFNCIGLQIIESLQWTIYKISTDFEPHFLNTF